MYHSIGWFTLVSIRSGAVLLASAPNYSATPVTVLPSVSHATCALAWSVMDKATRQPKILFVFMVFVIVVQPKTGSLLPHHDKTNVFPHRPIQA